MANALVNAQMPNAAQQPEAPQEAPTGATLEEARDAIRKQSVICQKLTSLLMEGGPVPKKKVVQVCTEIVAERVMSAQAIAGYLADLPDDPEAIREWVEKHAVEAENGLDQILEMVHGVEATPEEIPEEMMGMDEQPLIQ